MGTTAPTDEALLAGRDPGAFERFYRRHVETLLGFFARRTHDPELAADLTAETFAAALGARRRYRPEAGAAAAWLFGIAMHKLADAQRRGYAERRARRRLGMERLELDDDDYARIEALAEAERRHRAAGAARAGPARRGPRARHGRARLRRDRRARSRPRRRSCASASAAASPRSGERMGSRR